MFRLFMFLLTVLAVGFGLAWVADRPGDVSIEWLGQRYEMSVMVAVTALVALFAAIIVTWMIVSAILRSPTIMRRFMRNRRRDQGYYALSHGLIAASAGNAHEARKLARDSRRLLGTEPLVQLLDAQTLLLEGHRDEARKRYQAMLEDDDTALVALRGLYLDAERAGDTQAARHFAEEAAQRSSHLPWAGRALLKAQSLEGNWEGALRTLEQNRAAGLVEKPDYERQRAVLLTAQALSEEQVSPDKASRHAKAALKLSPGLVPAATVAARTLVRTGDLKGAAGVLENAWRQDPHPDIAEAYVHLRAGDSVQDRLHRARKLQKVRAHNAEGAIVIARAAIDAGEYETAREAMKPLIASSPTRRICLLMADLEAAQYGDRGRMRDWLARAVRAPRDPGWIADGYESDHWLPVSPVTGEIDAFDWKTPVARLGGPDADGDVVELERLVEPLHPPEQQTASPHIPFDVEDVMDDMGGQAQAAASRPVLRPDTPSEPAPRRDSADDGDGDDPQGPSGAGGGGFEPGESRPRSETAGAPAMSAPVPSSQVAAREVGDALSEDDRPGSIRRQSHQSRSRHEATGGSHPPPDDPGPVGMSAVFRPA